MNWKNLAFWVMILIVIGLSIYLIFFVRSNNYQCIQNPSGYFFKLLSDKGFNDLQCICVSVGCSCTGEFHSKSVSLISNITGIYVKENIPIFGFAPR